VLGNILTKYKMELHENSDKDMEWIDQGVVHTVGRLKVAVTPYTGNSYSLLRNI
jgi:hypothetical protein